MKTELWIAGIYQSAHESLSDAIVALARWELKHRATITQTGLATMSGLVVEFKQP